MLNKILQRAGTGCLIAMYVLMSYFPEQHPWNIVAGMAGGSIFLLWSWLYNREQLVVNLAGVLVCAGGLYKAWG